MIGKIIRGDRAVVAAACGPARLDPNLEAFLLSLDAESGLSLGTIRSVLRDYLQWLVPRRKPWREAVAEDVRSYLLARSRHSAASTIALKQWAMRRLYAWAEREELALARPGGFTLAIRRQGAGAPYAPSTTAIDKLLVLPDTTTPIGVRDRAILELLYATGMRASELLGLDVQTFDPDSRHCQIVGKGRKERIVVFGQPAADWVRRYRDGSRRSILDSAGFSLASCRKLFVHAGKAPEMPYESLYKMVKRYAAQIGLGRVTPHSLRHAFATHLYQSGANLRVIQMLLGHDNLQSTSIYVTPTHQEIKELLERHHPRGRHYKSQAQVRRG